MCHVFPESNCSIKRFTLAFNQLLLEKRPLTRGTQIPSLNSPASRILQSPKHGEIKHRMWHPWLLDSAAQLARQSQRRCWRLYGVQTGKDGTWWSDCPTPAASGAVARVKSALCAEPCFLNIGLVLSLMKSSTLFLCDSLISSLPHPIQLTVHVFLLIQKCDRVLCLLMITD